MPQVLKLFQSIVFLLYVICHVVQEQDEPHKRNVVFGDQRAKVFLRSILFGR